MLAYIQGLIDGGASTRRIRELEAKVRELEEQNSALHANTMSMALFLSDYFHILKKISLGDLNVTAGTNTGDDLMDQLGKTTNEMIASLKELTRTVEIVASGNLNVEVVPRSDADALMLSFKKMTESLRVLLNNVNTLSTETNHSAGDMAEATRQVTQTMTQVQSSIQQIATATNQIAKSAHGISMLVQNTSKNVDTGSSNISKVTDKFRSVQNTIEATSHSISKLNERSQEISEILGLITKIADQTNLLALNAAIEAARAGEAGRGFAVVADEVRKLAESSSTSAGKITQIVKEIQQDTGTVVTSSQASLEEAKSVLDLADKMRNGYSEIVESIRGIHQEVEQIAATSEETAASSEEITAGTEEQTAAITEIAANAQILADRATKLKGEVDKFRM